MPVQKRIVFVGDDTSGKTALINVLCSQGHFPEKYIQTTWEKYTREIQVEDGQKITLIMTDTAGHEDYDRLRPFLYGDANPEVVLLCFSIGSSRTLENVKEKWKPELRHYCYEIPIILIGNKMDLRLSAGARNFVSREQGREVATLIRAVEYLECSAKTNDGMTEIINAILRAPLRCPSPTPFSRDPSPTPPNSSTSADQSQTASPSLNSTSLTHGLLLSDQTSNSNLNATQCFTREDPENLQEQRTNSGQVNWTTATNFSSGFVPILLILILVISILQSTIQTFAAEHFTIYGKQCIDGCRNDGTDYYWCNKVLGGWDKCSPGAGKTIYGASCASPCEQFGKSYYWCYTDYTKGQWDYCGLVK